MTNNNIDKTTFWREHLIRCSKSGMTRAAYCAKHQLSLHQMGYWRGRLKLPDGRVVCPDTSIFMPVSSDTTAVPEMETTLGVQIVFPSGIMIECSPTTDMAWLAALAGKVHRM